MKLKNMLSPYLILCAFFAPLSPVYGNESDAAQQAPADKKQYKEQYTPAGEKCTKEADEKNLISQEWRKFMVDCMRQNRSPRPHEKEVEACFKMSESIAGTEKSAALKECLAKIDYARKAVE